MMTSSRPETLRFGEFELDLSAYELRRLGRRVRLGRQPMELLILLVKRRRQLVSRGDIVDRLWGKSVFVDVDMGVNPAISKIRQALRDSADAPAFLETVPGKGYRFIAAVDTRRPATPSPGPSVPHVDVATPVWRPGWTMRGRFGVGVLVILLAAGLVAATRRLGR